MVAQEAFTSNCAVLEVHSGVPAVVSLVFLCMVKSII